MSRRKYDNYCKVVFPPLIFYIQLRNMVVLMQALYILVVNYRYKNQIYQNSLFYKNIYIIFA